MKKIRSRISADGNGGSSDTYSVDEDSDGNFSETVYNVPASGTIDFFADDGTTAVSVNITESSGIILTTTSLTNVTSVGYSSFTSPATLQVAPYTCSCICWLRRLGRLLGLGENEKTMALTLSSGGPGNDTTKA